MVFFKKYISFVLAVSLCLQVVHPSAADFGYIPIPGSEVAEVSSAFGEMIKDVFRENPRVAAVLLMPMLAVPFIMKRAEISSWAEKKYSNLEEGVKSQAEQAKDDVKNMIPSPVRVTMAALAPLFGGFSQYFSYNKWHMSMAGIVATIGKIVGHPLIGAGLSGATLMKGYFDQGLAKVDGRFDNVEQQINDLDERNTKLHQETQKKIDLATQGINDLKNELDDATKTITNQVSKLEGTVSQEARDVKTELSSKIDHAVGEVREDVGVMFKKVEVFGSQVIELNKKLQDMPEQILQLTSDLEDARHVVANIEGKSDQILEQNKQAAEKIDSLSQQLQQATDLFVGTKTCIDVLMGNLADQIKDFIEKTTEKLAKSESNKDQLFEQVSDLNTLLLSLQLLEKQNGESIQKLALSCRESEAKNKSRYKSLKRMVTAQESSVLNIIKQVNQVDERLSSFQNTYNSVLDEMKVVKSRIVSVEKQQIALEGRVESNQSELLQKFEEQKKENEKLRLELASATSRHSGELISLRQDMRNAVKDMKKDLKEIKQQNKETQTMVQQVGPLQPCLPYQQIVGPHVPIYQHQSFLNKNKFDYAQQQVNMAAVLAVAFMQQGNSRLLGNGPGSS